MSVRPEDLVEVADDVVIDGERPILLHALDGFMDAGSGGRLAAEHLVASLEGSVAATFDVDLLLDYRARRPPMVFEDQAFTAYVEPRLVVHRLIDEAGVPFLLLTGPEPDVMWRRFVDAVDLLIGRLGVRLMVGLTSIPWATPHTRPVGVIAHSRDADLVRGYESLSATVRVPGHIDVLLEQQLGERGRATMGFAAQVPHYLSQVEYPDAAARLLDAVSGATGLTLPTASLLTAGEEMRHAVDGQIAESPETLALVRALEEQYDNQVRAQADGALPSDATTTGDDLAAQFERFLAERDRGSGAG